MSSMNVVGWSNCSSLKTWEKAMSQMTEYKHTHLRKAWWYTLWMPNLNVDIAVKVTECKYTNMTMKNRIPFDLIFLFRQGQEYKWCKEIGVKKSVNSRKNKKTWMNLCDCQSNHLPTNHSRFFEVTSPVINSEMMWPPTASFYSGNQVVKYEKRYVSYAITSRNVPQVNKKRLANSRCSLEVVTNISVWQLDVKCWWFQKIN